jgi:leader peptidase (prepilin peptidase)/N-methyltransferase
MNLPLNHWLWLLSAFLLGSCIGSFLNVVIYRLPLGLSVNEPRRSFCPHCREAIPAWLNLPVVSWLWLRGKCRSCGAAISFRYVAVELLTGLLFVAVWVLFAPLAPVSVVGLLWVMLALTVAISFIDAEHMIIPLRLTWTGTAVGLLAGALWPQLPELAGVPGTWLRGLGQAGLGWVAGFVGLGIVVELGKLAFGKRDLKFANPVAWCLREPVGDQDPMLFVIDGQETAWWDIFCRKTDRLLVEATDIRVDGISVGGGQLTIQEEEICLPDGRVLRLEKMKSLDGTATGTVIPREAMGMGDPHLLGMIGAFFGWTGVIFTLFSACVLALVAALIGRIGFGRPLPFGPFLALGAGVWLFGGWKLFAWYVEFLGPLGLP